MSDNILLIHGALGSRRQMDDLAGILDKSYHVKSINLPGHGGRSLPDVFTMDMFVEDTAAFISSNLTDKTHIFGFSMGGYVALLLALKHPELVRRIATLGTKFDWTPKTAEREMLRLDTGKMKQKVPDYVEMLRRRHAPQDWKIVVDKTKDLLMRLGNGEALVMSAFAIDHPVQICRGAMDHMVTDEESRFIAEKLENGRYDIIPGFRHPIEKIDKEVLADRLENFFKEN